MAYLESHGGVFRICFRVDGKQIKRTIETSDEEEAVEILGRVKGTLRLIRQGRLVVPANADPVVFIFSDGKVEQVDIKVSGNLGQLCDAFLKRTSSKESNSRYTEKIHLGHLRRVLGAKTLLNVVNRSLVQDYVVRRSKEPGRRGKVSHVTIKKEVATLSSLWRWAVDNGHASGQLSVSGLTYDKTKEKPPFQTWDQIERQIKKGASEELWDSVFLSLEEIDELLAHVRQSSSIPWLYPMFLCAAHTGMRRSELLRSQIEDFDFQAGMIRVREKKKDKRRQYTFRHVPISESLKTTMQDYFRNKPNNTQAFTTREGGQPANQTSVNAFRKALANSKWQVLRGWHVLRHSFASNCAMKGIDQRLIDEWLGHQTDEMSRRYRHLFPTQQKQALATVFK